MEERFGPVESRQGKVGDDVGVRKRGHCHTKGCAEHRPGDKPTGEYSRGSKGRNEEDEGIENHIEKSQ